MSDHNCKDCGKLVHNYFLCGLCYYKRIVDNKNTDWEEEE